MPYLWDLKGHVGWRGGGRGGRFESHHMGSKSQRVLTSFYRGSWLLKTPSKDFNLAIGGGLGWIKWLKNGAEKGFIFHAIFPALYPFWSKFYSQSWKSNIVTKMWRLKRWWYLSKLDYYYHKFDFDNFFSCPVKL